ncbi:hypothetical protein [Massilia glaciei]|uniref:Uncharacterized protein n=1 Tax=Massilia glaciei TaxID=1524097 RepID=A0A2U2HDQ4_9BURK|nr:hypothetical protein [Massilia glaciei]PWF41304.1 hypothetical protein C7C56_024750 [Massilia glaciei]
MREIRQIQSIASTLHRGAVFTKTAKGRNEVAQRSLGLSSRQRHVLILVDGVKQLHDINKIVPEEELARIVDFLQQQEMISQQETTTASMAPIVVEPASSGPPPGMTEDPEKIAALKRLLSETALKYLGLLSSDIRRRIDAAQDSAQLFPVLGQWHMALRQSKHGGAFVGQYLVPIEASFYGGAVPDWPRTGQ